MVTKGLGKPSWKLQLSTIIGKQQLQNLMNYHHGYYAIQLRESLANLPHLT